MQKESSGDVLQEKMFLETSQNSQENTSEFYEISKNVFFYGAPPVAASSDGTNATDKLISRSCLLFRSSP